MKKSLKLLVLLALIVTTGTGCAKSKPVAEPITLKVSVPDGIPALTMTKMIKESTQLSENIILEYTIEKTTDALGAKVLSQEADIAIVPSNLAAQVYNKELGYHIAATGSWGSFYLISEENMEDISGLKGKEVTTIGKNLTPDLMLRHILSLKEITPDVDVTINYLNGATELAPNFLGGKTDVASVPEPMLSMIMSKKSDTHIILDFNEEWKAAHESENGYPQSSLIVKKEVLEAHHELIGLLLEEYEKSIIWGNENPKELGEYAQELQLAIDKEVLSEAIKRANMKYVPVGQSKDDYSAFFKVLFEIEPKTIGGKIPDEGIYFK